MDGVVFLVLASAIVTDPQRSIPPDMWVRVAVAVLREAVTPGGIDVPPDEAHRWLTVLEEQLP